MTSVSDTVTVLPGLGHLIELAAVALFAWCWLQLRRQGAGEHRELILAALYGWLLEALDMRIFGTYHYGRIVWWWLADVPLYIPLLWATIVHSSMALSDRSGLPDWARPFLDGVLAVLIDLTIDAVAIRVGLWHWRLTFSEGWFGVPAGNLYAWMWVAWWYSAATRWVRRRAGGRGAGWKWLLLPVVAYAGLLSTLLGAGWLGRALGLQSQNQRLWMFAAHAATFGAIVWIAARRRTPSAPRGSIVSSLRWNRWLIHGSFLLVLAISGIWQRVPALVVVAIASIVLERALRDWCECRPASVELQTASHFMG